MAQTIWCDFEGCDQEHDLIVSVHQNGDTAAWCYAHFAFYCRAYLAEWDDLNPPTPPDDDDDAPSVADQIAAGGQAAISAELDRMEAEHPVIEPDPGTAQVVKRGTSPSRRRHEAKRREKARQEADPAGPPA